MKSKINLELKHECGDFSEIRKVLKNLGAEKELVTTQVDYFFNVPSKKGNSNPRLKLRIEKDQKYLIYYERPDFKHAEETVSDLIMYDIRDNELVSFLEKSLGIKAIVKKKREIWRKTNTVFHLDTVDGVGNIFEVELRKEGSVTEEDKKIFKMYQEALIPFLGKVIKGSNVDLVLKSKI